MKPDDRFTLMEEQAFTDYYLERMLEEKCLVCDRVVKYTGKAIELECIQYQVCEEHLFVHPRLPKAKVKVTGKQGLTHEEIFPPKKKHSDA